MKLTQRILSFVLMIAAQTAFADSSALDYVERLAKQMDYIEQQTVWPGFHPLVTPSVIFFEADFTSEKTAFAVNFKPGKLPWRQVSNTGHTIHYLSDASMFDINKLFADVDGQYSYIANEDLREAIKKENVKNEFIAKRAEYYFSHEATLDRKHANDLGATFASFNDMNLVKLYYLEDAALTMAQQADSGLAEDALRDSVAIHQYRNSLMPAPARVYENANEILHGIPVYIGWTSKQLNEENYKKMAQRTGCAPLQSLGGALGFANCIDKNFPAFTSSVYGHALEKKLLGQPWKQEVEKQFKSFSQIAMDYYHFSNEQAGIIAKQAMKKPVYHYDRIEHIVGHVMPAYLQDMQKALNEFQGPSV